VQRLIISTSALVLGFAFASTPALPQNIQGPAAPNFGLNSSPQTGGISNNAPNANTAATIQPPLYNYAPDNRSGRAQSTGKHATGGYRR
jgi:hypothetical protein